MYSSLSSCQSCPPAPSVTPVTVNHPLGVDNYTTPLVWQDKTLARYVYCSFISEACIAETIATTCQVKKLGFDDQNNTCDCNKT